MATLGLPKKKESVAAVEKAVAAPPPPAAEVPAAAPAAPATDSSSTMVVGDKVHDKRRQVIKEAAEAHQALIAEENKAQFDVMDDETGKITPAAAPTEAAPAPETPADEPATDESAPEAAATAEAAPAEAPAAVPGFDPNAEYELIVNGKPVKVKGDKIIERGRQALQKEDAADQKLELASRLLMEAQAARGALPQGAPQQPAKAPDQAPALSDEQLAELIQFGTKEQAAQAITMLRGRPQPTVSPEQLQFIINQRVTDGIQFNRAKEYVESEYADLFANDYVKRLFFAEEERRRRSVEQGGDGDRRPHKELYDAIGSDLRKALNMPKAKPAAAAPMSMEQRTAAKAAAPAMPRTAAARIGGEPAPVKVPTVAEIVEQTRRARHQQPNIRKD